MPCSEWSQEGGSVEYRDRPSTQKKLNKVTRLLCSLMKDLKSNHNKTYVKILNPNLAKWWIEHQKQDKKRLASKKKKK